MAKADKLNVVGILREAGSAHVTDRKIFNEMILRIMRGEANGIIVWDESRIARNAADGGMVINMFDIKKLEEIRKPGKTYRNTPDDKFFLNLIFGMSKKESDDKGVNVRRGLATKADKGWLPAGAKPGYMNDKFAEKGSKTWLTDPVRFPLIRKCWDLLLTGAYNPPMILRKLNNEWGYRSPQQKKQGNKPMARSKIYRLFQDPFYYGYFEYPSGSSKWHKGKHQAMITEDEFNKAQLILGSRKGLQKPKTREFAYNGGLIECGECHGGVTCEEKWRIRCDCGYKFSTINTDKCPECGIRVSEMKNKVIHYIYLHCTKRVDLNCSQKSIRLEKFEPQMEAVLGGIKISERFKNWALKYLNELNDKETADRRAVSTNVEEAIKLIDSQLDNLTSYMISPQNKDGSILSTEEFKTKKLSLLKEKETLIEQRSGIDTRMTNWMDVVADSFDFAISAKKKFETATKMEKRELFFRFGSKLFLKDGLLDPFLEKPFCNIERIKKAESTVDDMLETKDVSELYGNLESKWTQNPTVLAEWNRFRTI